jgi:hypothetical protein
MLVIAALFPGRAAGQATASGPEMGAHFGLSIGGDNDGLLEERVGMQILVPLVGPVAVAASVARFFRFPEVADAAVTGSGWRTIVTGRFQPLGRGSFLSFGAGLTAARFHREDPVDQAITWWETAATVMVGLEAPFRRLRPFAELYVFGRGDAFGASTLLGLNIRAF